VTEREKMLAGEMYLASDPPLVEERHRARRLTACYSTLDPAALGERRALLLDLLGSVGEDVWIEAPFFCDYGANITLGDRVFMNFNCVVLDCAAVTVGADTMLAPAVQLSTATHPVDARDRQAGLEYALPITIGRNVWVGAAAIVGPGVTIGDDSVIGAGAIVLRDVPAGVLAAGNPCRVIREL
jgi:maltose O-acetyltransferase